MFIGGVYNAGSIEPLVILQDNILLMIYPFPQYKAMRNNVIYAQVAIKSLATISAAYLS